MKKSTIFFNTLAANNDTTAANSNGAKQLTPAAKSESNKSKAVLEMKEKKIVLNDEIAKHIVELLNLGFYVKNNEQKTTISANRYGKKGQVHVELMATNVVITKKGEAPIVKTYSDYMVEVQSEIVGDPIAK